MAFIPTLVRNQALIKSMRPFLISQGKVGDQYSYPDNQNALLAVRSNRLSVYDFVLPLIVEQKGQTLTALTDYWAREILSPAGFKNHLLQSQRYPKGNRAKDLRDTFLDIDLTCSLAIMKVRVLEYELIFRFHLGGSVWTKYLKNRGVVAGVQLPLGMKKWQKLDEPLFTPSTKAKKGHDINISQEEFFEKTGESGRELVRKLTTLCKIVYAFLEKKGILMLDTKVETSEDGTICDEFFTPDTSWFVTVENYFQSIEKGVDPDFMDKQPVRDFCAQIGTPFFDRFGKQIIGLSGLDPEKKEHCKFVAEYDFPRTIAEATTARYLKIFKMITGMKLTDYQKKYLL